MKKNNYLKVISWPILFGIGQILLLFVIGLLYLLYGGRNDVGLFINDNLYIVAIANLIIFFPLFYNHYKKYKDNYQEKPKHILLIIVMGIAISFILNYLIYLIKIKLNIHMSFNKNIFLIINTALVGPVLEEYLFRGIVFNKLLEFNGIKKSYILTTIIFALMHQDLISIIYAFLMGLILNYIYIKQKNIIGNIIFHIAINLTSSLLFPLIIMTV